MKKLYSGIAIYRGPKFYCICFIAYLYISPYLYPFMNTFQGKLQTLIHFTPKYFRIHIINEIIQHFRFLG